MKRERPDYTRATIASWDEAAPIHGEINRHLDEAVRQPDFNNLNPEFQARLQAIGLAGRSCVQVCCNNGIDLISARNLGAGRCLGIDGSTAFIAQATGYGEAAGLGDIEFLASDVYDLDAGQAGEFDIAMVTVGVVNWMPDLDGFFARCARLLADGGHLVMEELHPVLGMYEEGEPSRLEYSYFNREPFEETTGLDYFTGTRYQASPNYWFQYTLSDILTALGNGFTLQHFEELPRNIGNFCADLENVPANPPLAFVAQWQWSAAD